MTGMVGWAAWKVSSPEWLPLLKGGADGECDWYVWITCPNGCGRFRTTAASVRKNKSSVCRTHIKLRSCQPEDEAPVNVFPSQRCRTVATIHQGCNERIAALQQNVSELQESRDSHETRIEQLELRGETQKRPTRLLAPRRRALLTTRTALLAVLPWP
jgi:hypothetical protein